MSTHERRSATATIGHNLPPEQRRAEFEAVITSYVIEARNVEAMSLDEVRLLSDKQRLVAYQHGHLISTIRACRKNDRLDAYLAVRDLVFAMAALSKRICMLSARQMGAVLARDERTIRRCLDRLIGDGLIVRIEHRGLFNAHFPALDRNISTETGSPDWIINAFSPDDPLRRYRETTEDNPGRVTPRQVDDTGRTAPGYPGHAVHPPRTSKAVTPGVDARQSHSINPSKQGSEESSPSPSQPKTNVQPVESWGTAFAAPDHEDVVLQNGRIVLLNGARSFWVGQFDGHEGDLNLALIEAAGSIQPNSKQPVKLQVERILARKCSDRREKDRRYAKAVKDRESKAAEPKRRGGRTVTDICMEGIRDEKPKYVNAVMERAKELLRAREHASSAEPTDDTLRTKTITTDWVRK